MALTIRQISGSELAADVVQQISELAAAAAREDANPPFSDQTWVDLRSGASGTTAFLADGADGTLTGAAMLTESEGQPLAELVVAPAARRGGVGTELSAAVVDHLVRSKNQTLNAWAHGGHPGAAALAKRHGLAPVRDLWRMLLQTPSLLAQPEPPEGVRIRHFIPGEDDAALLSINAAAFAHHPEQGELSQADLDARKAEAWFNPEGLLLAVDEQGQILAFHWTKVDPAATDDSGNPLGEVYVVGVSPSAQGKGLGKVMTIAGIHWLVSAGLSHIVLYVDADNAPAVALYQKLGFTLWSRDVMYSSTSVQ